MNRANGETLTLIGAGMAGTLLAVLLARRGYRIDLFERNPDPRRGGAPAGRSVNLALGERGLYALRQAGLLEEVHRFAIPMRGRMLHDLDGSTRLQPYGKDESEVIYSVHRARLNECLLGAAEALDGVNIHFDHRLEEIDWTHRRAQLFDTRGETRHEHAFGVIIGLDGAGSAVRQSMANEIDLGVSEELLETGYKEFSIPAAADGSHQLDPNALHIWPRGGFMLIALANSDGSFTLTLFLDNHAHGDQPGFDQLEDWSAQKAFMEEQFVDAVPLITNLEEEFRDNPVGLLGTIRCRRWHLDGRGLIIGDAAHAIVPFHGQGVNAAFEDCVELIDCIGDGGRDWNDVFEALQERRIDNANAIADMALENYEIMRESVRHEGFLLRKALEHELERRHPGHFVARYSLVMFHRGPYAEAYRRGEAQAEILDALLEGATSLDDIDYEKASQLINERLNPLRELS
ncbi:MAG: NAD(P)/FAD-dependent oxidoreductase [Xanthomonadales bacterium]|nr:NAD(P)/FAD-dependent oxidoreductase [Xanthomonadales bacterium]